LIDSYDKSSSNNLSAPSKEMTLTLAKADPGTDTTVLGWAWIACTDRDGRHCKFKDPFEGPSRTSIQSDKRRAKKTSWTNRAIACKHASVEVSKQSEVLGLEW